jgi:hypothetical protein
MLVKDASEMIVSISNYTRKRLKIQVEVAACWLEWNPASFLQLERAPEAEERPLLKVPLTAVLSPGQCISPKLGDYLMPAELVESPSSPQAPALHLALTVGIHVAELGSAIQYPIHQCVGMVLKLNGYFKDLPEVPRIVSF